MDTWKMIGILGGLALIFFVVTAVSATNDYNNYQEGTTVLTVEESIEFVDQTEILIDASSENVEIYQTDNSMIEILYEKTCSSQRQFDQYKEAFHIDYDSKTVQVYTDTVYRNFWYDNWLSRLVTGVFDGQGKIRIGIPENYNETLEADLSSGSINVNDISVNNIKLNNSSGRIIVEEITAMQAEFLASSGSITVQTMDVENTFVAKTSSGRVILDQITATDLGVNAGSGSINLTDVQVIEEIKLEASSGRIVLENVQANNLVADNSSGSVIGTDLIMNLTEVNTSSGRIDLSGTLGLVRTEAGSGSILITCEDLFDTISAKASSGRVEILLPDSVEFEAYIDQSSGSFSSNFLVAEKEDYEGYDIYAQTINGEEGIDIYIATGSGSIAINELH